MTKNLITRKIQFLFLIGAILLAPSIARASAVPASVDSLQNLLQNDTDARQRAIIYIHLADIHVDSLNISSQYWDKALTEAAKAKDEYMMKLALDNLIQRYASKNKEKVEKYITFARQYLPEEHNTLFRYYLYCYNIWAEMRKNNSLETIEQELDKLKKENHGQMTPEEQIQWEYLTGVSLDYSAVLTHSYNEVSKAIPYVERALEILAPYPLQDRVHFEILCHYELADLYTTVENKKAVDEVNKMIELHKQWNHLNTTFDRRFLDESHYYMAKYSQIIFMADLISKEEIKDYYQKYIQIANKKKVVKSTYETTARYYQTIGEYKKAIAYIDSATQTDHFQPVNLVPILNAKAGLYYKLNDYKNAYLTLKESNKNRMSDKSQKREQQMIEMQTRFDVNKLELEKSKLANKNKQIALTGTFILLLAAIGWSIYQRTMVKRLKKMHCALMTAHEEVRKQSIKATESEKMKTAFLNSICHEIRTPLNSIAGFSELIFDESLDTATRQEFRQLIQSNSTALASLMDNMLELSQLVSSELPLPVESTDVYGLCVEEMAKLKETLSKPNIECIITGDKDELQLATDITKIILTRKGVSEFDLYDRQAMMDKYGFTPTQFIDFKGLMGDQSDNIPGIPGVGEKTATKLILEYGSVENLIANVDNVKPKGVKAKVEEHAQLAMMSKRLATINTQVPMDIDFAEYKLTEPDYDALIELYSRLEFNRFLKKLNVQRSGGTGSGDPAAKPLAVDAEKLEKVCVREDSQLAELTLQGRTAIKVFGDHNHLDVPQIEGVAAVNGDTYYYFDCRNLIF